MVEFISDEQGNPRNDIGRRNDEFSEIAKELQEFCNSPEELDEMLEEPLDLRTDRRRERARREELERDNQVIEEPVPTNEELWDELQELREDNVELRRDNEEMKDKINDLEKELDDTEYELDDLKIENENLFRDGDDFQLGIRQNHRRMRSMMEGLSKELDQLKSLLHSDSQ